MTLALMPAPRIDEIVSGAGWLPDFFDGSGVRYVRAARAEIAAATFLDQRFTEGRQAAPLPAAAVRRALARLTPAPAPVYVFHTAFCGSTLLARALDVPGRTRALREPFLVMREANAKRRGDPVDPAFAAELLGHSCAGERAIVKPSNAANNLAPDLMAAPGARALILHADLRAFLVAVLTRREDRRAFVRRIFRTLGGVHPFVRSLAPEDLVLLTDLKIAAFSWRLQAEPLIEAARLHPARVASLHVERFLAAPAQALAAAASALDLGLEDVDFDAVARGPLFDAHAKNAGQRFDPEAQAAERCALEDMFGPEIEAACAWARKLPFAGEADDGAFPRALRIGPRGFDPGG